MKSPKVRKPKYQKMKTKTNLKTRKPKVRRNISRRTVKMNR